MFIFLSLSFVLNSVKLHFYFCTFILVGRVWGNCCIKCIDRVSCILCLCLGIDNTVFNSGISCSCIPCSLKGSCLGLVGCLEFVFSCNSFVFLIRSSDASDHYDIQYIHTRHCKFFLVKSINSTFSSISFSCNDIRVSSFFFASLMKIRPLKFVYLRRILQP